MSNTSQSILQNIFIVALVESMYIFFLLEFSIKIMHIYFYTRCHAQMDIHVTIITAFQFLSYVMVLMTVGTTVMNRAAVSWVTFPLHYTVQYCLYFNYASF